MGGITISFNPKSYDDVLKTVSLDFDGVFNEYTGWDDYLPIRSPRKNLPLFLKQLSKQYNILICTSRNVEDVENWIYKHNLSEYIKEISNTKYPANVYVDDRAIQFNGNYNDTLNQIKSFKPYWEEK